MRIALVVLGFAPVRMSGLDIAAERLVKGLLDEGHHVTLMAGCRGPVQEVMSHPNLQIHRLKLGRSNWIGYSFQAAAYLKHLAARQEFDVVHFFDVHFGHAFRGKFVASLQQSFHQRRISRNGPFLYSAYCCLAEWLMERPAVNRAAGLLATSLSTQNEYLQHYHVEPERVALARYGFDTTFFIPRQEEARLLRKQFGIGDTEPVIMFAGFVTPRKGLEYLAQAMPRIQPKPRLVIVGRWQAAFREKFINYLGSSAGQLIEAGFVPDEWMPVYYSMADVYVSPTLLEGFGFPPAEAMACGTPVVASCVSAVPEVVGPGGILVSPGDSSGIANAVSELLNNPEKRLQMAQSGRAHIVANFSIASMLRANIDAYHKFFIFEGS